MPKKKPGPKRRPIDVAALLRGARGNVSAAARAAGVTRPYFHQLMKAAKVATVHVVVDEATAEMVKVAPELASAALAKLRR